MKKEVIKVLVVDDSAFIRVLLSKILESDESISVVATAEDPYDARKKIKRYKPDVLTLDIEMPKMDGLTFLDNIMRLRPMPVIMVSTLTHDGADMTLRALRAGAFDFVSKPSTDVKERLTELSWMLIEKVKAAAECNAGALEKIPYPRRESLTLVAPHNEFDLIAIGASTGGTEAIKEVISCLPDNLPPIVMAQHIPDVFSSSYAKRLNAESRIKVQEVREPIKLARGCAYLAPGHKHMKVKRQDNSLWAFVSDEGPVNRHKPSVDVLFDSVCQTVGSRCIAAILTGMGQDGAAGILRLKKAGALTIAQDESSSVIWGMPGAAVKLGGVEKVLSLNKIPEYLVSRL